MKFYRMLSEDIRYNLATEEYLMNNVDVSEPCLLLYIQKPCVIIGRNQNAYQEIDFDYLRSRNIVLTRRTSGGGAVYDDLGNMSFSFVTKKDATSFGDYQSATQPIMKGLAAMGAKEVEVHGRNDLFIDGKKFSGNAMYIKKGRTYSHGTLMYDVDLEELTKVLHVAQEKIASKATKSVRKSVTNIKPYLAEQYQSMDTKAFRDTLLCHIYEVESIDEISEQEIVLTDADRQAQSKRCLKNVTRTMSGFLMKRLLLNGKKESGLRRLGSLKSILLSTKARLQRFKLPVIFLDKKRSVNLKRCYEV